MTTEARLQQSMLPASAYADPAVLERERRGIFAREWTFVAPSNAVDALGAYVAGDIAGMPYVVVNDGGTLRGHANVCRHRGGPLVDDAAGTCKGFVCRYHGWAYGLDGGLQHARDFGTDVPAADYALATVRVEAWRGLVFVNFDAAATSLTAWLGGFAAECDAYPMETFAAGLRSTHHIEANWKVYAENYQEGYHIPLVHPGLNRQIDARRYEVEVRDGYCVHRAPTRDGSVTAGAWLWKFPALALNIYPDGMCVETYAPTGAGSTRVDYAFFFASGTPQDEIDAAIASSDAILDEDRTICEAVQRNMASGIYVPGPLSPRHEGGVAEVQRQVLAALADAAD